jgi:hypothetical protein
MAPTAIDDSAERAAYCRTRHERLSYRRNGKVQVLGSFCNSSLLEEYSLCLIRAANGILDSQD